MLLTLNCFLLAGDEEDLVGVAGIQDVVSALPRRPPAAVFALLLAVYLTHVKVNYFCSRLQNHVLLYKFFWNVAHLLHLPGASETGMLNYEPLTNLFFNSLYYVPLYKHL